MAKHPTDQQLLVMLANQRYSTTRRLVTARQRICALVGEIGVLEDQLATIAADEDHLNGTGRP